MHLRIFLFSLLTRALTLDLTVKKRVVDILTDFCSGSRSKMQDLGPFLSVTPVDTFDVNHNIQSERTILLALLAHAQYVKLSYRTEIRDRKLIVQLYVFVNQAYVNRA